MAHTQTPIYSSWRKTAAFAWRRFRNIAVYLLAPTLLALGFIVPFSNWLPLMLTGLGALLALAWNAERVAKNELADLLAASSESAKNRIKKTRIHYTNAGVVQEVGHIAASNLDIDILLKETVGVLKSRLTYQQCSIFLYEKENEQLIFATGYGYDRQQLDRLQSQPIELARADGVALLRSVLDRKAPLVTETPWRMSATIFPEQSRVSDSPSNPRGIIVPLATNQSAIGLLAVLESEAGISVTTSDINFLLAIASQVAVGINNAAAFQELQESESKFRQILETIEEGYFQVDFRGRFTFVNPALCRITGYSKEQLYAMDMSNYADSTSRDKLIHIFGEISDTGRPVRLARFDLVGNKNRHIAVELSATPIQNKKGQTTGFRGIISDVSERIQAEKERKRIEEHLQQIQKLESIGRLAGGIAHNFNNLLMGIQGNVSLINLDVDPKSDVAERTAKIESIIANASKLTGQLLGFARGGKYQVKRIDLNGLIETTSETFEITQRKIRVHRQLMADLPAVEADRNQIEQVLWNLYMNAADAMPKGGDVFLETGTASHVDLQDLPYNVKAGRYVKLRVTDNGGGMDPATRERVFEPFFTTKDVGEGTGLGLASVYGIVKGHGGYIEVESALGRGSTFYIFLPSCKAKARLQQSELPPLESVASNH